MSYDIECKIFKDLLPVYLDGIASEDSNMFIRNHLTKCEMCLNYYNKSCNNKDKNIEDVNCEIKHISVLKKKLIYSTIGVLILGITLVAMQIFCVGNNIIYNNSINFKSVAIISQIIAMNFLPIVANYIAFIWKNVTNDKEKKFWPDIIFMFLTILNIRNIIFIIWEFIYILVY